MKFFILIAALAVVASGSLTGTIKDKLIDPIFDKVANSAACKKSEMKVVCDAFAFGQELLTAAATGSAVKATCMAYNVTTTKDLNVLLDIANPDNAQCKNLLSASCSDNEIPSTLQQIMNLLQCATSDLGGTIQGLLKGVTSSLGDWSDLLHAVEIVVMILLNKLIDVVCRINLTASFPGLMALLVYVVISLGAALSFALGPVGMLLFLVLLIVLALLVGLAPVLVGVTGLVDALVTGLKPTLVFVLNLLNQILFPGSALNLCITGFLKTVFEKLLAFLQSIFAFAANPTPLGALTLVPNLIKSLVL